MCNIVCIDDVYDLGTLASSMSAFWFQSCRLLWLHIISEHACIAFVAQEGIELLNPFSNKLALSLAVKEVVDF